MKRSDLPRLLRQKRAEALACPFPLTADLPDEFDDLYAEWVELNTLVMATVEKVLEGRHVGTSEIEFRKEGLDELAASLERVGMLEPIILRRTAGSLEVVVGERRYRAAQQAGLDEVPAIIADYSDEEVVEINLIENVQREDLNDVEKGRSCQQLLEKYPDKYPNASAIANQVGVAARTVNFWIQTARDLSPTLQRMVATAPERGQELPKGKITSEVAVNIARRIPERERQVEVAKAIAERRIPSRAAREVLRKIAREPEKPVQ